MQRALQVGYGLQSRKQVLDNRDWSLDVQVHEEYSNIFLFSKVDIVSQSEVRGVWLTNCNTKGA